MSKANFQKLVKEDRLGDITITGRANLAGGIATAAGSGITTGTGTVIKTSVERVGTLYRSTIYLDITGLHSSTTNGDIIGKAATAACFLTQIKAQINGAILGGTITCLVAPTTGDPDIDLYSATEATGTEDGAVGSLTETALYARAASWAAGDIKALTAVPAADEYLYLTVGNTGVPATYGSGKFLIELIGN